MTRPGLIVEHLTGGYGEVIVVEDVTLSASPGTACCITGRNGVGKSTLLGLITGALIPRSGSVHLNGEDLTTLAASRRYRLGMSYAPQERIVFDTLTVAENLTLHHNDRSLERYEGLFAQFPRMKERLGQKAGTLSGGEKKILSFCRAVAEQTSLVILDEPTEGVQSENITRMGGIINEAKAGGRSFVIVEQNLSLVEQVADDVLLIDHGRVIYAAPFERDATRAKLQELMML